MIQIAVEAAGNPFAILSFIVAPAVLTNASSVLAMSTSNRLARAVDQARELAKQLEEPGGSSSPEADRWLSELSAAETRTLMLVRALQSFYLAMGGFSTATLLSLVGAVLVTLQVQQVVIPFELIAVVAGLVAVGSLVQGSVLLVRETRIAFQGLQNRSIAVRARIAALRE
jgi:hypothetical protein